MLGSGTFQPPGGIAARGRLPWTTPSRQLPVDARRDHITRACLTEVVRTAAKHGRFEALKYLTADDTSLGRRGQCAVNSRLLAVAAQTGHVPVVAHLHRLLAPNDLAPCRCKRHVGDAAWRAPTVGVALWMRDNRCSGYVDPDGHAISSAVSSGRVTDVARMLAARAGLRASFVAHGRASPPAARPCAEMCEIERGVAEAARKGDMAMMDLAIRSLCHRSTPVLIGAARGGQTDLLAWATAAGGPCTAAFGAPAAPTMRAAATAAAMCNQPAALRWIARHFPDAITPSLVWTAAAKDAVDAMRALDDVIPRALVAWDSVLSEAMIAGSLTVVRLLVEERGVALSPLVVIASEAKDPSVTDYVCQRLARDQLQLIVDAIGARPHCATGIIERLRDRVPTLCVAVANATHANAGLGDFEPGTIKACACARCAVALVGSPLVSQEEHEGGDGWGSPRAPTAHNRSPLTAKRQRTDDPW